MNVLCIGSAACKDADIAAAAELGVDPAEWVVVGVNHAGRDWPGLLDHWVTFHCENMPAWAHQREKAGLLPAANFWTTERRPVPPGIPWRRAPNWGGSSGLLAIAVGLELKAARILACGIPLDHEQGHYDSPGVKWRDAVNYRRGWKDHLAIMGCVRSMSGWTRGLLGAPDEAWLAADGALAEAGAHGPWLDPVTQFCIRCGAAMEEIVENAAMEFCPATDNVRGISHVLARAKFERDTGISVEQFGARMARFAKTGVP